MSSQKPEDEQREIAGASRTHLIETEAERLKREISEENRRQEADREAEKENSRSITDLQAQATKAETSQAASNVKIVRLTCALLAVATVSAIVSALQFIAAMDSADAARQATVGAVRAIESIEHQFQIDERAYVWVSKADFPPKEFPTGIDRDKVDGVNLSPGGALQINVFLRNNGRTPANNLRSRGRVVVGAKARRGCFTFATDPDSEGGSAGSVVGAGGLIWFTVPLVDDEELPASFVSKWTGEYPVMVYFETAYDDVFNLRHRSKACLSAGRNQRFSFVKGQSWMDYTSK